MYVCLPPHCCVAHACCALSASPSNASWHDRCPWAARQMLMRTAAYDRCASHGTWHDVHDAVWRAQLARPAYAAFSAVSSAVCARSSAVPAGSVSTAAPTGEIVRKWEWLWRRGNRRLGMGLECGKVETGGSERGLSGNGPRCDRGVGGIPSLPTREPALGSSNVRMQRAPRSAPTVRP